MRDLEPFSQVVRKTKTSLLRRRLCLNPSRRKPYQDSVRSFLAPGVPTLAQLAIFQPQRGVRVDCGSADAKSLTLGEPALGSGKVLANCGFLFAVESTVCPVPSTFQADKTSRRG